MKCRSNDPPCQHGCTNQGLCHSDSAAGCRGFYSANNTHCAASCPQDSRHIQVEWPCTWKDWWAVLDLDWRSRQQPHVSFRVFHDAQETCESLCLSAIMSMVNKVKKKSHTLKEYRRVLISFHRPLILVDKPLVLTHGQCDARPTVTFPAKLVLNVPIHKLSWYSMCLYTEGWPGWVDLGGWLHTTFFRCRLKTELSSVLTTDTAPVKRLYCCVTHFHFPAAFCCGHNLEAYRL